MIFQRIFYSLYKGYTAKWKYYGTSIQTTYSDIYYGTTSGILLSKNNNYDSYYNGNFNYPRSFNIDIDSRTYLNKKDYDAQQKILANTNTYVLQQNTDTNVWISIGMYGSCHNKNTQIGNFYLIFSDNKTYTLSQAVNNNYIEPLVLLSSSHESNSYLYSNVNNIITGGNTSIGDYASLFIYFKVKNVSIKSIKFYSNKEFINVATCHDGFWVYQINKNFDISLTQW